MTCDLVQMTCAGRCVVTRARAAPQKRPGAVAAQQCTLARAWASLLPPSSSPAGRAGVRARRGCRVAAAARVAAAGDRCWRGASQAVGQEEVAGRGARLC